MEIRSSYLHNGISYTGKMSSLYWIKVMGVAPLWFPSICADSARLVMKCNSGLDGAKLQVRPRGAYGLSSREHSVLEECRHESFIPTKITVSLLTDRRILNTDRTYSVPMMTSWNGNIFRVTGHLCGELTGPRWIPRTKASDAELWCYLWSAPE